MPWGWPYATSDVTLDAQVAALRDELAAFRAHAEGHFTDITQRIIAMSQSLSQQLDAVTQAIRDDVAAVSAEVGRLLGTMQPGSQITQAQVDALTAIDTSLKAIPSDTPAATPAPAA
jgi:hypothetical protein